jgi:hypothetical protein
MLGRIAVTYVEWAGASHQEVIVPWSVIEQPADSLRFADRLSQSPTNRVGYTSISGAIDFSLDSFARAVSSPLGRSSMFQETAQQPGPNVTLARDEAVARASPSTVCRSC